MTDGGHSEDAAAYNSNFSARTAPQETMRL